MGQRTTITTLEGYLDYLRKRWLVAGWYERMQIEAMVRAVKQLEGIVR